MTAKTNKDLQIGFVYYLEGFTAPKVWNGLFFECLSTKQRIPATARIRKRTGIHLSDWSGEIYQRDRFFPEDSELLNGYGRKITTDKDKPPTPGQVQFEILGDLPSLNKANKAAKTSPYNYAVLKKKADTLVSWSARAGNIGDLNGRYVITCDWFATNRRTDPDNISHGIKYILDGLQGAGILKNDGWTQIAEIRHRFHVGSEPRVIVTLEPVGTKRL